METVKYLCEFFFDDAAHFWLLMLLVFVTGALTADIIKASRK